MTITTSTEPVRIYRGDYRLPDFSVDTVRLRFELGEDETLVSAAIAFRRNVGAGTPDAPLVLLGEELELVSLALDGAALGKDRYEVGDERLTVLGVPDAFLLESVVRIRPQANTVLMGLYKSSGNFCTQCEAEGFRRITWYLDRPDVMARFTTEIVAEKKRYPVLLSNGNRIEQEDLPDGRHRVVWEDPFKKPSYLFALVAGDLACHRGTFTTRSDRAVALEIWVEPQNADKCEHALQSLKDSMAWDEEEFGLEYDLDVYMVVAVSDFNMGAMENKGLNIFNSKFVLARPDTATDADYESIQGVIAHEYFHNWTGNRVTCRDWFQLTLKEGLTVFRDQRFSADMTSAAVKRIQDVRTLRTRQLPEDAGPMSHPIRPESYIEMNNFYTATVYEKGAEVIRLYDTLLGREGFKAGMRLYFERHDGSAVTCDDFRAAMADANGRDLAQFERWYLQAGTLRLAARGAWDESGATYTLTLAQHPPKGREAGWEPMHVPVRFGLVGPDGCDLPLAVRGQGGAPTERVLELTGDEQRFVFEGITSRPVPSVLRGYSAPVELALPREPEELAFLLAHDSDPFNRWDAGQTLFGDAILTMAAELAAGRSPRVLKTCIEAFRAVLVDPGLDGSFRALALTLPDELVLAQRMDVVDPDALHSARELMRIELARAARGELERLYESHGTDRPYSNDPDSIHRRRARNCALAYLATLGEPETTALVRRQFESADNMTDSAAALVALSELDAPERERALAAFYERWEHDPLVIDKWFTIQATATQPGAPERVRALAAHAAFKLENPNRARALVGAFAMNNPVGFHAADGEGYRFVADHVLALDAINRQVAARIVGAFNHWKRYDAARQKAMKGELERIAGREGLSKDVFEIVERALASA